MSVNLRIEEPTTGGEKPPKALKHLLHEQPLPNHQKCVKFS